MRAPWRRDGRATTGAAQSGDASPAKPKRPLYPRLLRLRHVRPNGWQRAALGEGALALAVVLVLADVASAWTLLVLPLSVAAVVKAHDVLAGLLQRPLAEAAPLAQGAAADGSRAPAGPSHDDGAGPRGGPAPSERRGV